MDPVAQLPFINEGRPQAAAAELMSELSITVEPSRAPRASCTQPSFTLPNPAACWQYAESFRLVAGRCLYDPAGGELPWTASTELPLRAEARVFESRSGVEVLDLGDVLELSDLIQGTPTQATIGQFVTIDTTGAVSVDSDGNGAAANFVSVATLAGVTTGQVNVLVGDHDTLLQVNVV